MKLSIQNDGQNIGSLMRAIGYIENRYGNEPNYARPLSASGYPRFHIYPKQIEGGFELNLHLDAKKPSYGGSSAHNGEYNGAVVEGEAERIRRIL